MKYIDDKVVFSEDIALILKGKNALGFNYSDKGLVVPDTEMFKKVREDFLKDVQRIFANKVAIISEEEMLEGMWNSIRDVLGRYPHCILR